MKHPLRGLVAAGASLVAAFCTLWLAHEWLGISDNVILLALLGLPLIVYLAVSGRLSSFKVGSIEASLLEEVGRSSTLTLLNDGSSVETTTAEIRQVLKAGTDSLSEKMRELTVDRPPVLVLKTGTAYEAKALNDYLRDLQHFPRFKFVLIVDGDTLIAYLTYYDLKPILDKDTPERAKGFLSLIAEKRMSALRTYPGVRTQVVKPKHTVKHALKIMLEENLECVLVVDSENKVVGVVERDQVLIRVALSLSE